MNNEIRYNKLFTLGGGEEKTKVSSIEEVLEGILELPPIIAVGSISPQFADRGMHNGEPQVIWNEDLLRQLSVSDPMQLRMLRTYFEKRVEEQKRVY